MTKKFSLSVLSALFLAFALMPLGTIQGVAGAAEKPLFLEPAAGENPSLGKTLIMAQQAQQKTREIPLAATSVKKVLPPPVTVTAVRGKTVTLRDFYGQADTVEVDNPAGVRVGDKGFLKNGFLILGVVPE